MKKAEIARQIMYSHTDSAQEISLEIYNYSKRVNFVWGIRQGYLFLASTYHRIGQYDTAIVLCQKAIELKDQFRDSVQIGNAYLIQGMCFVSTGKYELGAEKTLNSLRIFESLPEEREDSRRKFLPRCYNILGQVYYYQSDFETTREYFVKYLELATEFNDTLQIGSANTNLGAVYFELGDYDKAMEHDLKSAKIQLSLGNKLGYANALQNIATGLKFRDEFKKAIDYYDKALTIYFEIPNKKGITETYYNLGELYLQTGDYVLADINYKKAIDLSFEANDPDARKWSIRGRSKVAAEKGNHELALSLYKDYHDLSDSLVNEANLNKISELQVAYDTERKEQEIEILNTQNQLQAATIERNRLVIALIAVVFLFGAGLIFIYFRQRNYKMKAQFESEKSALKTSQIEAVIRTQESERKRFAMDLHDNFGQLISALRLITSQNKETKKSSDQLLDKMYGSLKQIAFNLMPATLVQKNLTSAVEELASQISESNALKMESRAFVQQLPFDKEQEIGIYRIIQELTSNIVKYADASTINVDFTQLDESLQIMISDDGTGYDPTVFFNSASNGWKNISSRLDLLHGEMDIDSSPGSPGSTVIINIATLRQLDQVA